VKRAERGERSDGCNAQETNAKNLGRKGIGQVGPMCHRERRRADDRDVHCYGGIRKGVRLGLVPSVTFFKKIYFRFIMFFF
jgi:hypothetical protein